MASSESASPSSLVSDSVQWSALFFSIFVILVIFFFTIASSLATTARIMESVGVQNLIFDEAKLILVYIRHSL